MSALVATAASDNLAYQFNRLYPDERYMVVLPIAIGSGVAAVAALAIALLFLPSVISTTLKLRTGIIPSVADPELREYYIYNVNKGTYLFGAMFWGYVILVSICVRILLLLCQSSCSHADIRVLIYLQNSCVKLTSRSSCGGTSVLLILASHGISGSQAVVTLCWNWCDFCAQMAGHKDLQNNPLPRLLSEEAL